MLGLNFLGEVQAGCEGSSCGRLSKERLDAHESSQIFVAVGVCSDAAGGDRRGHEVGHEWVTKLRLATPAHLGESRNIAWQAREFATIITETTIFRVEIKEQELNIRALAKVVTWWDESSFDLVSDYIVRGGFREILELPGWQQVDEHYREPIDERHISASYFNTACSHAIADYTCERPQTRHACAFAAERAF